MKNIKLYPYPSLDRFCTFIIKCILHILPLRILGQCSYYIRWKLQQLIEILSKKQIQWKILNKNIEICIYNSHNKKKSNNNDNMNNNIIIHIHGGGFTLRDPMEIQLCEIFMKRMESKLGYQPPPIYSIVYDVIPIHNTSDIGTYNMIMKQVIETYQSIIESGKNVVAIMGDSAGGNLALSLTIQLQNYISNTSKSNSKSSPRLILLSPWLDMFPIHAYQKNEYHIDYLDAKWISLSRESYLSNKYIQQVEKDIINYKKVILCNTLCNILMQQNIKVVVFDMDQCIVKAHSNGCLLRSQLQYYLNEISYDFILLSKILKQNHIKLAIATFSDELEVSNWLYKSKYIIGKELVDIVLNTSLPELVKDFYIVTYNPLLYYKNIPSHYYYKRKHIQDIANYYQVQTIECILFDDDYNNCHETNNEFHAYQVNSLYGFEIEYIMKEYFYNEYIHNVIYSNHEYQYICHDINMNYINPGLLSNEMIDLLPPILTIHGDQEMLCDDIKRFMSRIISRNNKIHKHIIGKNEIHVYPGFVHHPLYFLLKYLHFEWMFQYLYPKRHEDSEVIEEYGLTIHSKQSYQAICEMVDFIIEGIQNNDE